MTKTAIVPIGKVEKRILILRDKKVLLSTDLAVLYDVEHRVLTQAVRRNNDRFPSDFMFQLDEEEFENLKSQIVISSWGGLRKPPHAFTEQGIAMLSSVLRSKRAVQVNIAIMRTFVQMREMAYSSKELAQKLDALERKYDSQFKVVFDAIRQLMQPPAPKRKQVGFHWDLTGKERKTPDKSARRHGQA